MSGPANDAYGHYTQQLVDLHQAARRPRAAKIASEIHRLHGEKVAASTIKGWIAEGTTTHRVPRSGPGFGLMIRILHVLASRPFDRRGPEKWEAWRDKAAQCVALRNSASASNATSGSRDAGVAAKGPNLGAVVSSGEAPAAGSALIVGAVPDKPLHFIPREQVDFLKDKLSSGRGQVVVVTGMHGAGKTQLAGAYARHVIDNEGGLVGWVNAETDDTLHNGLAEVADRLGIAADDGDPVKSAHRLRDHLNSSTDRHLLILDNATDPDQLRTVVPTRGSTRIVITTTDRAVQQSADITVDAKTGYTPEQALTYLHKATGIVDNNGDDAVLAQQLGCLPLALTAAAAAINAARPPLTYQAYLQRLRKQPLPRALRRRAGTNYLMRTDQAILLSIQAAEAATDDPDLDNVVAWLLGLFAILAPSGVPRKLLQHPDSDLNDLVDDAIARCTQHCLLNWSIKADKLIAHRLTARVLLERARETSAGDQILKHALAVVQPHLIDTRQAWARRAEGADLVDQIEAIWDSGLPDQTAPDLRDQVLAIHSWAVGQLLVSVSLDRALTVATQNLVHCDRLLGSEHPATLSSRNNLAGIHQSAGRVTEAIPLFERNLADYLQTLGPNHDHTLNSRNNLASAYERVGRWTEAIPLLQQTFADRERALGPEHPDTLASRSYLAYAYRRVGRVDEAIVLFEQILADRERVLGPEHPDTLASRNHIGSTYREVGRLTEAIPLLERTLTERERVLGADHPDTLTSRNNLAGPLLTAGRETEAIALFEQTLADRERVLGPTHPDTLTSRGNLASACEAAGHFTEALELYRKNAADRERLLGDDHPQTLNSRNNLAACYVAVDRVPEAIPLFEQTLADRGRILGPDHPDTLHSRSNLAGAYLLAGRETQAIVLYEKTLADRQRVLGPNHPATLKSHDKLALARRTLSALR